MLRVAGSLKWGTVNATALILTLQRGGRPTVGRAIGELGRILLRPLINNDTRGLILIG